MLKAGQSPSGACGAALALGLVLAACVRWDDREAWSGIRDRYFTGFLKRNPITSTYLGGGGYSADLVEVDALLPDVTPAGRAEAAAFYRGILRDLEAVDPAGLAAGDAIDRDLVRAQIGFLLHQAEDLRAFQRSLDTDTVAPFRGIDWQIQQMTDTGGGRAGTREEWERVARRARAVPDYLRGVEANLRDGLRSGNPPDWRMVQYDGIDSLPGHAAYFRATLPDLAGRLTAGQPWAEAIVSEVRRAGSEAAAAFEALGAFLAGDLADLPRTDRFAAGEAEYDWRLRNNFRFEPDRTAAALFEYGAREVEEGRARLIEASRRVAERRGLGLAWDERAAPRSVRAVMDDLGRDHPKNDEEMFRIYRARAQALVEFARAHAMFDLPADYRLEIVPTPPMLESTLEAAYYPAPPFKTAGIGRFYLTASHGDLGVLKENNIHAVADLCAHEGFPGHDWHHQFMRARARSIANVRWLTPGAVEDSSSMWQDSLAAEGWALYAEQLVAEPQPGAPEGFYTPEERLYQLKWELLRAARVRIDTGIHTGRMGFDEAVDYYLANVEFLPDACWEPADGRDPVRAAACNAARRAIYRYSKWPTQAITYNLGKRDILDLRDRVRAVRGDRFSLRAFHERFMEQGTIPAGYFRETFLRDAAGP